MTATSTPFGMQVVINPADAPIAPTIINGGIASGYATAIYQGSPVALDTNGNIVIATTAEDIIGVFAGCSYTPANGQIGFIGNNWTASSTYVAGTMNTVIWDNPMLTYRIQCNGSLAQTSIGDQADFVNPGTGNATTGISSAQISSTLVGAGVQGQLRILNLEPAVDNAWGDAFTVVRVQIARHEYVYNKVAV